MMTVRCTRAAIGYERLEGSTGSLSARELPLMGYTYTTPTASVAIDDIKEWRFAVDDPAQPDPIIEAARMTPMENNPPPAFDGGGTGHHASCQKFEGRRTRDVTGFKQLPWGSRVRVQSSSDRGKFVDQVGTIQPRTSLGNSPTVEFAMFCPDGADCVPIFNEDEWEFTLDVPPPPRRRARENYDQKEFVADLDLAINHIRSVVLEQREHVVADPHIPPGTPMRESIARVCDAMVLRGVFGAIYRQYLDTVLNNAREMLIAKNQQYGNSALDPVRVFSQASLKEQLLVRLDDKVSRLARGSAAGEDVASDMLGYLLLVAIAEKRERE